MRENMTKAKNGRWYPSRVKKVCPVCKKDFLVKPSHSDQVCCSRECRIKNSIIMEYRDITCQHCEKVFNAKAKKGIWPVFCSMICKKNAGNISKIMKCPTCKENFLSDYSKSNLSAYQKSQGHKGSYKKYCSSECYRNKPRIGTYFNCCNCGKEFYKNPSTIAAKACTRHCCSAKCSNEFNRGTNSTVYKGGRYIDESTGHVMINVDGVFRAEHRLIVEEIIGRLLRYHEEPILHINGDGADNEPSNLYVCKSMTYMGYLLQTYEIPYPVKSNVISYK